MLKIYDKEHNAIGHIVKYKDLKIESDVTTGDKTLSFTYLSKYHQIEEEFYLETEDDEYVIKEKSVSTDGFLQFVANLNLEDLEAKPWSTFSVTDSTIEEAARLAIAGSGWRVKESTVDKKRNAGILQTNTIGIIRKLCTAFMCEVVFDTKEKTLSFYEQTGSDKGVYFMSGLNMKKLQRRGSSYDYYTRIIPIGADGSTIEEVNEGKNYLENYQYSNKVKTYIWKDESYTDATALLEDAVKKLEDMSKPEVSYSVNIMNLAADNLEYGILDFNIGDTVTLIDAETGIREKQRIVKLVRYPQNSTKDTCELANRQPSFEEMRQKQQEAQEIIDAVINSDGRYTGTISVSDILKFEEGVSSSNAVSGLQSSYNSLDKSLSELKLSVGTIEANYLTAEDAKIKYATISELNVTKNTVEVLDAKHASLENATVQNFAAVNANINSINADNITIKEKLTAAEADITRLNTEKLSSEEAKIKYAEIESLNVLKEKVGLLDADVAGINTLMFGSAFGESIQTSFANAVIAQLGEAQIKSAMIESLVASKITSGDIITNNVRVLSEDGKLLISDETIQISDENIVRVQIGKDASKDYSINIWDENGNLMFSEGGITDKAIKDAIIRNDMVSENANISAGKLDISSLFDVINNDGSHTLKSSKIYLNEKEQTLDVAFTSMTTSVAETTATANTALSNAATAQSTADAAKTNAANAQSTADTANTKTDANTSEITKLVSTVSSQGTQLSAVQGQISSKIWKEDITSEIEQLEIGGRNLLLNTNFLYEQTKDTVSFVNGLKDMYVAGTHLANIPGKTLILSYCIHAPGSRDTSLSSNANMKNRFGMHGIIVWSDSTGTITTTTIEYLFGTGTMLMYSGSRTRVSASYEVLPPDGYDTIDSFAITVQTYAKPAADNKETWEIGYPKLEFGTKATDWTPAPEDVDANITTLDTQYSEVSQKVDSITATIADHTSQISNKADSSTVTTVSDKVTKLEASLDGFKSTVSDTYATKTALSETNTKASNAQSTADTAKANATNAQSTADTAKAKAATAQSTADSAKTAAANAQSTANTANSTANALVTRVTNAETAIEQNASDITLRATKTELNTVDSKANNAQSTADTVKSNLENNYYTKSQSDANLSVKSDAILASVKSTYTTKEDFDSFEIGGRNLLRKTNQGSVNWYFSAEDGEAAVESYITEDGTNAVKMTCVTPSTGWQMLRYTFDYDAVKLLEANQTYTLSFDILTNMNTTLSAASIRWFDASNVLAGENYQEVKADEAWHKLKYKLTTNDLSAQKIGQNVYISGFNKTGYLIIKNLKLEKGNKATDWTPAPEDLASADDLDSLTTRVTESESNITQLSNKITTEVSERTALATRVSTVEQTASGLAVRLNNTESTANTALTNANKAVPAITHAVNGNGEENTYVEFATITINGSYVNYPAYFKITGREFETTDVQINFISDDAPDPSLASLKSTGGYNVWMYKKGTSTWGVITKLNERWGRMAITDFHNNTDRITFTWTSIKMASLPSGCVSSTPLAAATTATNYLNFSNGGLVIGDMTTSKLGKNVLIDTESINIRDSDTVLATFAEDMIELGKNSASSVIKLCGETGKILAEVDEFNGDSYNTLTLYSNYSVKLKAGQNSAYVYASDNGIVKLQAMVGTEKNETLMYYDRTLFTENIELEHNKSIRGYTSGGTSLRMMHMYNDDFILGYGGYANGVGKTSLRGNVIEFRVKTANTTYKPYYEADLEDGVSDTWMVDGIISASAKRVYFTIPLSKPIIGNPTVTVSSMNGLIVRQNGSYVYGTSSTTYAQPSKYTASIAGGNCIHVIAYFDDATNAVNNYTCYVKASISIEFS